MTEHRPTAITIGTFDGVHVGHAALVRTARDEAERLGSPSRVVALVFDPHPLSRLAPGREPARLTTFEQRARLLRSLGVDHVARLEPTDERLAQTPEAFVQEVVERFRPDVFVEGRDFRFGKARAGDVGVLADLGRGPHDFAVRIVDDIEIDLSDQTLVRASSTMTRWLVREGRVADAGRVLGRPFTIEGEVKRGDRRGRTIGYPTANVETSIVLPRDGVYAGIAHLPRCAYVEGDDRELVRTMPAAVHVGPRATFDAMNRTMEVYVAGWEGPVAEGGDEYGWPIAVELRRFLRDQIRFGSVEALCAQMARDVDRTLELTGPLLRAPHEPAFASHASSGHNAAAGARGA